MKRAVPIALTILLGACFTLFFGMQTSLGSPPSDEPRLSGTNSMLLQKILTDQRLWGQDAFAVFAALATWKNAGETSIVIFPDRVLGGRKSETLSGAEQSAARLTADLKRLQPKLRSEYQPVYRQSIARTSGFRSATERFLEDDSFRVVLRREGGEFLKNGINMRTITDLYGKPEKITTEVVQSQGDRRPAVLTVHSYANGAIKFVQSDLSPTPESVDRAVVDVTTAAAQLY
jgi:hypothetical protein